MRIAMPDLRYIVKRYMEGRYEGEGGPEAQLDVDYQRIDSPAFFSTSRSARGVISISTTLPSWISGFAKLDSPRSNLSSSGSLAPGARRTRTTGESRLIVEATK